MHDQLERLKHDIVPILRKHGVVHAAIFGSLARGSARPSSDLDLVVEFDGDRGLLDLVALKQGLEDLLRRKVDVVTYLALHPRIKQKVLREQVRIF